MEALTCKCFFDVFIFCLFEQNIWFCIMRILCKIICTMVISLWPCNPIVIPCVLCYTVSSPWPGGQCFPVGDRCSGRGKCCGCWFVMSGEDRCCFNRSQLPGHKCWFGGCDRRCGSWFVLLTSPLPARRWSGLLDLLSKQGFSQHIFRCSLKSFLPVQLKMNWILM